MSGLPEDDYRLFNTEATLRFARAAERARVKRFVFLSSMRAQAGPTAEGVLTEERDARAHRRLWPVEARSREGPRGDRTRLGRAAARARLRSGRPRQCRPAHQARPLALSAASCRAEGASLAARPRQSGRGGRPDPRRACALAAAFHRRRPQAAHHRRDRCRDAAGARAPRRPVLRASAHAQSRVARGGTSRGRRTPLRFARRRSVGAETSRLDAACCNAARTRGARATTPRLMLHCATSRFLSAFKPRVLRSSQSTAIR